ncbi:MAG TPA: peptidoglycan DD-metalloendopeptidase family protein [Marmoricola sp.]|nr:peptidoglycan DD-metalloendopeptidase family protein [Marmoricola sp.]
MKTKSKVLIRAVTATLALGLLASPAMVTSGSSAATQDPKWRKVSAPNVFYPVTGTRNVKDLRNFSARHRGTDIRTACGAYAYASHPGVARVVSNPKWAGKYAVRILSNSGGLMTTYAYLSRPHVTNGQIIQSGQSVGTISRRSSRTPCGIYFAVKTGTTVRNPSSWLTNWVGKTPPVSRLFGNTGFNVASFNILGASHTPNSRYGAYAGRLDRAMKLWDTRKLDVIGTQEFQEATQWARFQNANKTTNKWGTCYWDPGAVGRDKGWDTENAILFRNSRMEVVPWQAGSGWLPSGGEKNADNDDSNAGCKHFDIPYFSGNIRHVPVVLLRDKATGRTAFFMNVHNPANTRGPAQTYRDRAVRIEKDLMIKLRSTGRPVFLMGDFNDRERAFCPLTANKLSISPNSIPSTTCRYPRQTSIDWIFAAGQTRFSYFLRDNYPKTARIADHPLVIARAHLQN